MRIVVYLLPVILLANGSTAALAQNVPDRVESAAGALRVEVVSGELVHPWGLAHLPDGRMLVTERPGRLRVIGSDGALSEPLQGVPDVFAQGQGGLLDVALDPEFSQNRFVYLSFAEARGEGAATSVGRGRLSEDDSSLDEFEIIFRQQPAVPGQNHFGSRLVFTADGHLFITLGDRFDYMDDAQNPANHLGTVARVNRDGSVPEDNPFAGQDGADEVWSYGHRNVQGAAIHPATGALWIAEHGPQGGDEVNIPQAGENHGWPEVSWGNHYDGRPIPDPPERQEFVPPVHHWTPAIAPSGAAFYTGDAIPGWDGNLLVGGLVSEGIVRLTLDGRDVVDEERISLNARVRDIEMGPDGAVYVLTDHDPGHLLRIAPGGD